MHFRPKWSKIENTKNNLGGQTDMDNETKVCKYCQTEIPKKAKICPNCKKKQGPKIGLTVAIAIVVLLILGAMGGGNNSSSDSASSDSLTTATTSNSDKRESETDVSEETDTPEETVIEYITCSVVDLEDAIQNNAMKATETYKNQYIEVTGYVSNIDASGKYIDINAGSDDYTFVTIQCYIKSDEQKAVVMEVGNGDSVTVRGKVTDVGELMGYSINIEEIVAN